EESPEHSWFELVLGIVVEGQHISLLPVLLDVIRKTPTLLAAEQLAQRRDDEVMRIALGRRDREHPLQVLLPFGRLKPILATLGDLYLQQPEMGDGLRLDQADAARLIHLDTLALEWRGGERLREFAERLRDYRQRPCLPPVGLN